MKPTGFAWKTLLISPFILLIFLFISVRVFGQGAATAQFSVSLSECLNQACGAPLSPISWEISGSRGTGHYPMAPQTQLTLEHLDSKLIAVRSQYLGDHKQLISALYMGRIDGNQIKGVALYYEGKSTQPSVVAWQGVPSHWLCS